MSSALLPALPGYCKSRSGHGVAVEVPVEMDIPAAPHAEL